MGQQTDYNPGYPPWGEPVIGVVSTQVFLRLSMHDAPLGRYGSKNEKDGRRGIDQRVQG